MPTYDYYCDANDRLVEVKHGMNEQLSTWAEVCTRAGIEAGDTPKDSPVRKLATGGQVISKTGSGSDLPPCATGGCAGGMCGLN